MDMAKVTAKAKWIVAMLPYWAFIKKRIQSESAAPPSHAAGGRRRKRRRR